MNPTTNLARQLIERPSVTPDDHGCQKLIADRLRCVGFEIHDLPFGNVSNLWATHGNGSPVLVFAGHSDVVPSGPESRWSLPPFAGVVSDGWLYGRGAIDMKGALAAMVEAAVAWVTDRPAHPGTLAFLVTSDEEGPAVDGTSKVLSHLREQSVVVTGAIIGEPSSRTRAGDAIRIGRRGSLSGQIRIEGSSGHVAYVPPESNTIHRLMTFLTQCMSLEPNAERTIFPPLSFHVTSIEAEAISRNVVPAETRAFFNLRYPPTRSHLELENQIQQILENIQGPHELLWRRSAEPYLSFPGRLRACTSEVLRARLGSEPELRVDGGTSDGRFFAAMGCEVIELGLPSERLHAFDERVSVLDLLTLCESYQEIADRYLTMPASADT
ncbi:MAG: succinyl-diaminopimelate desuccinylase [Gammaproteobacteria bacterium]